MLSEWINKVIIIMAVIIFFQKWDIMIKIINIDFLINKNLSLSDQQYCSKYFLCTIVAKLRIYEID